MVVAVGEGTSVSATASDVVERRKSDTITLAFIAFVSGDTMCETDSMGRSSAKYTSDADGQEKSKMRKTQEYLSNSGESQSRVRH